MPDRSNVDIFSRKAGLPCFLFLFFLSGLVFFTEFFFDAGAKLEE